MGILTPRRPGKGGKASSVLPPKTTTAKTTPGDEDDDYEKSQNLATEAIRSIQTCYRTCFAAVLADVAITVVDDDIWSKFSDDDGLSWVDCVDLFESLVHFAFGCGLYRIARRYVSLTRGENDDGRQHRLRRIDDERLSELLRTMAAVWGIVALNFAAVAVSMAAALPAHSRDGPLRFALDETTTSSRAAAATAACVFVAGCVATDAFCASAATSEDKADDRRIGMRAQKSKRANEGFASGRRLGYRAYRNQALCVWAFGLTAVMELLKWVADADAGVVDRLLSVSDVLAPFAIARLLFGLSRSFLRAAIVRLRDEGSDAADEKIYDSLFVAQTGFYKKVAETMKEATIYRLLPYILRPFWPPILSALEQASPFAAAKIVQLLDFFT